MNDYFSWLRECINWRVKKNNEDSIELFIKNVALPIKQDTVLHSFFSEQALSDTEKIIILLSLTPYYIPQFLQEFRKKDNEDGLPELFFNKSLMNNSVFPSIETSLYLLAGNNINTRESYFSCFTRESVLLKESILEQPQPAYGEPFTRATLAPSQSFLNIILSGEIKGPEFSHDFPATKIESAFSWDDLIIDASTKEQLEEVREWLKYENICKTKNVDTDIFKRGYKCLFHGPPGTGKTMAASLIGTLTHHPVYRIDLSAVVSKYIGETEKNLAKIFDRAAHGNWILFFDEADALFGKRSSTQSAHDRYANQEVSYLLQRFESYEGVSILATNFKENIDSAFYRRFHSIVTFKKPDDYERLRLWSVYLPKGFSYADDIDLEEISQKVKLTGAGIYNVMRRSCMKAVLNGDNIISGQDMYDSVKIEFAKENKTLI